MQTFTVTSATDGTSVDCTSTWRSLRMSEQEEITFGYEPEKPPKYDPGFARRMWARDILQETSRPKKRPSQLVAFNQVSRLRPVKPRYLSRKR